MVMLIKNRVKREPVHRVVRFSLVFGQLHLKKGEMSKKIKAVYFLASVFDDEVNMIENEAMNMLSNLSLCLLSLDSADEFVLE